MKLHEVVIVGGKRTAFVKSFTNYNGNSNQELLTHTIGSLVDEYNLKGKKLGQVVMGAVMKHSGDWNLAREVVLGTELSPETPTFDMQMACGTSLEATIVIANQIRLGQIDCGIAAGSDTNSDLPIGVTRKTSHKIVRLGKARSLQDKLKVMTEFRLSDLKLKLPNVMEPRTKLSMGQHCEQMAKEWKISRKEQDELTEVSHRNAANAYSEGFYDGLITSFKGVEKDKILREGTTLEKLKGLKPAFDRSGKGTLTAGNSTPLTDGAAAVFLCSEEYAKENNLPVLAHFIDGASAAFDFVAGEGLLMAPTRAVSDLLRRNNLSLQDFDFYEIHEAFAAQALCTLKAFEDETFCREKLGRDKALGSIDRSKMNVKGGSVAIGHPFAATGARIVSSLSKILDEKGSGRGLISICTAGGMGVAAIFEKRV